MKDNLFRPYSIHIIRCYFGAIINIVTSVSCWIFSILSFTILAVPPLGTMGWLIGSIGWMTFPFSSRFSDNKNSYQHQQAEPSGKLLIKYDKNILKWLLTYFWTKGVIFELSSTWFLNSVEVTQKFGITVLKGQAIDVLITPIGTFLSRCSHFAA